MSARGILVRFVVHRRHEDSGERTGLFQAINLIFAGEEAPEHLRHAIGDLTAWFNKNLRAPFRSEEEIEASVIWWREHQAKRAPDRLLPLQPKALSWIKASSAEHLTKLYHLKALVEEAGWLVDEIRTARPGKVLYEDEHQIVAIPYSDTPT